MPDEPDEPEQVLQMLLVSFAQAKTIHLPSDGKATRLDTGSLSNAVTVVEAGATLGECNTCEEESDNGCELHDDGGIGDMWWFEMLFWCLKRGTFAKENVSQPLCLLKS